LSLLALGVVYGDIGTSPLYAVNECFFGEHGAAVTPGNVLGVLSLITWSLIIAICYKYLGVILRADNRGEGGILALGELAMEKRGPRMRRILTVVALVGAAFLYSDGMLTPAISVLSAVEGLEIATPRLAPFVIPITIAIIVALFVIQHRGTARVGSIFGPAMVLYFVVIAVLGAAQIVRAPEVLWAINPAHAAGFLMGNGHVGFIVLGAVFLAITGGEALYADLGHFGKRPIRCAWYGLVLPALLLNYFGQGALLLQLPGLEKPYYHLAADWFLIPLVVLSSAAAVIASQALISGAFSLTAQAMQNGFCPRLQIHHTSEHTMGQIYVPAVNWLLMACCIGLVLGFGSSSNLASAYGIAIAVTMVVTTFLLFFVACDRWRWPLWLALGVIAVFLAVDGAFLAANSMKIMHGGWFSVAVTAVIFAGMSTWNLGRHRLAQRLRETALSLPKFLEDVAARPPARVPGTAVFMCGNAEVTPGALLHNLKHNKVVHERVLILTVRTESTPFVEQADRYRLNDHGHGFYSVAVHFGFKDKPDIPGVLGAVAGFDFRPMETSYFLGRETVLLGRTPGMAAWRRRIFIWLSRNSLSAAAFFSLPPNRVVELGMQVEI
jgi:KUP system potassium uptake protein